MPHTPTIIMAGPTRSERLFAEPTQAFQAAGFAVIRHTDMAAFRADDNVLRDADALLGTAPFGCSRAQLAAAPRLRAVVSPVTGTEGFDEAAASEHGVLVVHCQTPQNYLSIAESTVLLILAAAYDLSSSQRVLRDNLPPPPLPRGRLLHGKVLGLVGFGQIARAVADRLRGWGMRILVYLPRLHEPLPDYVERAELDDLLRQSDVVSLHPRLTAETHHMLDARRFGLMKPDVMLINTARGAVIDEAALVAFAQSHPEARLALDTFEIEPLPADSPLRAMPNAILTPHMVGHTIDTHRAGRRIGIEMIKAIIAGQAPPEENLRNPAILPTWRARFAP